MLTFLSHQGHETETPVRSHLISVRMVTIKKTKHNQGWRGWRRTGNTSHTVVRNANVQPPWTSVPRSLSKLEINLPHDSSTLRCHSWEHSQGLKSVHRDMLIHVSNRSVHNSYDPEVAQKSTNRSMDSDNGVLIHKRILFSYNEK